MIPYGRQDISQADIDAVAIALGESLITQGPTVERFEALLADTVGARFAVVFNSGTAALHAAYHAAGVGPGKGVLTSPITFVATANAALYLGAKVWFADVNPDSAMLDADGAGRAAQGGVAVLAPVHLTGHVSAMEDLAALASRRGWRIVEDAAHALGGKYKTRDGTEHRIGACQHSDMCCFSFHPVKHITTGEGGAVTTNDEGLARALRRFRSHGITKDSGVLERNDGPWYYEQHDLGFNYRLTDQHVRSRAPIDCSALRCGLRRRCQRAPTAWPDRVDRFLSFICSSRARARSATGVRGATCRGNWGASALYPSLSAALLPCSGICGYVAAKC
jgi:perosamine synthetase